ncbi:MAG TPA: magnesium transporter CorA family protein [Bacteroidales bacterium]|nr:magnesium transporter CorA family protein [Bacteroidales bacterium]HQK36744.1 magnesium transporter CorA family protein [Bacteroidales bacterium]
MEYKYILQNGGLVRLQDEEQNPQVIVILNPDDEEKQDLITNYQLDEHNLTSALDPEEPGRIEYDTEGRHMALILKRPMDVNLEESHYFAVVSLGLFLYPNRLIVVSKSPVRLFDARQINQMHTVNDIMMKIIYGVINKFSENLRLINMLSDSLEEKISRSIENRYLLELFKLEKSLVYYLESINTNEMTFRKLNASAIKLGFDEENKEVLDDILIENNQLSRQAETYSTVLAELMDARSSIINNNMNMLIRKLTIISIVFMPLNIIASMGGMSEYTALTSHIPWPISYGLFAIGLVLIGLITYAMIKNMGLERNSQPRPHRSWLFPHKTK